MKRAQPCAFPQQFPAEIKVGTNYEGLIDLLYMAWPDRSTPEIKVGTNKLTF